MVTRRATGPTAMDKAIVLFCFVFLISGLVVGIVQDLKRSRRMVNGTFYQRIEK